MATLQKVRDKGKILICIVGLALFAFIAEEFVRSLSYTKNESRQRVGEIYGQSISVQDFNALVDEYTDVIKFTNGMTTLSDDQLAMMRDQVWQSYVNEQLIGHECAKLGLTVTDREMQAIINEGRHPMLAQTPFRTQQGAFDVNALKQFLNQYDEIMNNPEVSAEVKEQYTQMSHYWSFVEKTIRQQQLTQKYEALLAGTLLSNPASAKASYEGRANESEIVMAALPYTAIKDADVEVSEADLKAKYEELKPMFRTSQESRDIKYIDIAVTASAADKAALDKEMAGYAKALAEGADPAKTVREAASQTPYSPLPVSAKALPQDIAARLDSMQAGQQQGPFLNAQDNTLNIVRLIAKTTAPDSVEVRQIAAPGKDMESAEKTADSIMNALQAGADFDTIAKKYSQPAAKNWITSAQYEGQTIDENNRRFISAVTGAATGSYSKIVLDGQGVIVAQVTDRRANVTKYDVAVVKRSVDFSKDTYGKAYNDFSSFLAGNTTADEIEANAAKAGYTVQERKAMTSAEHNVAGVRSTREALRWVFNEDTKAGDVSPLYECGDNDHLLVVILKGVHEKGYMEQEEESVKSFLTLEVQKDKKAELLRAKAQGVKTLAEALKLDGVISDTIRHITFANSAFVSKMGTSEPALSGAVSAAKKGEFRGGVKGNAALYAFQVTSRTKSPAPYDQKQEEAQATQGSMRALGGFTNELYRKADVTDKRYLFY